MKKVIGIAGGVGSGKSTVVSILRERFSAFVFIADEVGHEVFHPATDSFDRIVAHFGFDVLDANGDISHEALAGIVFQDEAELAFLNSIVHPYVYDRIRDAIDAWRQDKDSSIFVLENALLFETNCDSFCDEVWGVVTEESIRIRRLMESRGYSEEKSRAIIASQVSDEVLMDRCDKLVRNDGDVAALEQVVGELMG